MLKRLRTRAGVTALVTVMAMLPIACYPDDDGHGRDRENPLLRDFPVWGPAGTPLPAGAELVSQARFLELLRSGNALPLARHHAEDGHNHRSEEEDDDDRRSRQSSLDMMHKRVIELFLRKHPGLTDLKRLVHSEPSAGPGISPNRDGTWSVRPDGVGHDVELMGHSATLSSIYDSVLFARDRRGHLELYTQLYDGLASHSDPAGGDALGSIMRGLPQPSTLSDASLATVMTALGQLGRNARTIYSLIPVNVGPILFGCDAETGASLRQIGYGDRSGNNPACGAIPGGLYATMNFLNKDYPTCVKDQGMRGTCHSFAVASATEERYSLDQNVRVNLSEQDEMEHYRFTWERALYNDAGDAWQEINDMMNNGYSYPFEKQWDYNPSYARNTKVVPFTHSCDLVPGEPCSDTSPQPAAACGLFGIATLCILYDPGIVGSAYRPTAANYFWDSSNPELSTEWMLLNLAFNKAVVLDFIVSPNFKRTYYGTVSYDPADIAAKPLGEHAVHVVSFVSNEDLAQQLPNVPPGSGGGYFIIKNSWSTCFGDGGYVYLPWDYVKAETVLAFSVSSVN